jgi:hypothetical protein
MRGVYVFKENGIEIARSENLLTTEGKRLIVSSLAGIAPEWAGCMAIGSGSTSATVTDKKLSFEYDRQEVLTKAVKYTDTTNTIIVKTTLPAQISGTITEMGLFSLAAASNSSSPSQVLVGLFGDDSWEYYSGSAWVEATDGVEDLYSRVGASAQIVATNSTDRYRANLGSLDLTMYGANDKISFAAYKTSGTCSGLTIKFITTDANYYSYDVPTINNFWGATDNTYTVLSVSKGSFVATGTPSWASIIAVEFEIDGTTFEGAIDGIRIDDTDETDPNYALVSRSVLIAPVIKRSGTEMDIEYYLGFPA